VCERRWWLLYFRFFTLADFESYVACQACPVFCCFYYACSFTVVHILFYSCSTLDERSSSIRIKWNYTFRSSNMANSVEIFSGIDHKGGQNYRILIGEYAKTISCHMKNTRGSQLFALHDLRIRQKYMENTSRVQYFLCSPYTPIDINFSLPGQLSDNMEALDHLSRKDRTVEKTVSRYCPFTLHGFSTLNISGTCSFLCFS